MAAQDHTRRGVIVLLAVGAIMLVIAVATATSTMFSISRDTELVEHTQEVQATINRLSAQAERIETARRGYLIHPDRSFADIVRRANANFTRTKNELARLTSDNPVQVQRLDKLDRLDRERDVLIEALFASPARTRAAISVSDFDNERGVMITREIRTGLDQMAQTEVTLLGQRNRNQLASLVQFYVVGGLAFALLVFVMIGAIVLVMRYNRDLDAAQGRLRLVNEGLEDAVKARTTELSRANEEIQRFAYIVSHDLRSPLVNVLGFTSELDAARKTLQTYVRRFAEDHPEVVGTPPWLAVEEDIPEALGFIRASTEKMDRLINSILELSRQGRRQLRPESLDMTELAESVVATLKQRADAAGATVEVGELPPIESDRMAVEQIIANLTENSLKYLSPKRAGEIRITGRDLGRLIEIEVADNGRGIAPADHERIFDLFRRAGTQDQSGEGIGLANVRALAYRLGGRVGVKSQLDEGARFTLTLPKRFTATEPSA